MANNVPKFTQTASDTPANRGMLSAAPTPVRTNYTTRERIGDDLRGIAKILNTLTIVCPFLSLPPAASVGPISAFITDSPIPALGANQGLPASGNGTFTIPVYNDGQTWLIG